MMCRECEENLPLLLYGELPADPQAACEAHLAECGECRAASERLGRLHAVLGQRHSPEPSPIFMAECRQALDEALDRERTGWRGLIREWIGPMQLRPGSGLALAGALLVLGFGLGWTLRIRAPRIPEPAVPTSAASLAGLDLDNMHIRGISRVAPDPKTGEVHITLDAERRLTLEGSLDDPRIQQVLVYAIKSYDNPGIRRDTVDALRTRCDNPSIRQALLYAMRHDPNLGVRLGALDAVQGLGWGADVQQAFLDAVVHEQNPSVRVAAVDVLARHADQAVLPTLEQLAATDSNRYVRLRCASAMRKLGR
jgi:hypothetical protein